MTEPLETALALLYSAALIALAFTIFWRNKA